VIDNESIMRLLLATTNLNKVREIRALLDGAALACFPVSRRRRKPAPPSRRTPS
jgi:inosine/xanthosine triphosphate pyrophosphatase family protein